MAITVAELIATITLEVSGAVSAAQEATAAISGVDDQLSLLGTTSSTTSEQLSQLAAASGDLNEQISIFAPVVEESSSQLSLFAQNANESYQQLQGFTSNTSEASGQLSLFAPAVEETVGQLSLFAVEAASSYQQLQEFSSAAQEATASTQPLGAAAYGAGANLGGALAGGAGGAGAALNLLGGISLATAGKFLGLAGGIYELIKGLEDAAKEAIAWGEEVRRIQITTDLSAQKASDLAVAFMHVGLNTSVAIRGLALFETHIQSGTGKITQYFTAAEMVAMHNQTLAQLLPELSGKFQSLGSDTERTAFLMDIFGRRVGVQMYNYLSLTKGELAALTEEARKNGLELGQNQVDAAHNAQLAMNDLRSSFKAAEVALGQELMPAFVEMVKFLQFLIAAVSTAAHVIVDFGSAVGHIFSGIFDGLTGNMSGFHHQIDVAKQAINSLTHDAASGWQSMQQAAQGHSTSVSDAITAQTQASKALTDQQRIVGDMERKNAEAAVTSAHSIQKAREALVTQQEAYNKFIAEEPIRIWVDEVNAIKNVFDAQVKVIDQQKVLNDLLAGPTAEASQKAIDAVDNAVISLFDNQQRVIAAQKALNDIMNPPKRTTDKAHEDVAKAQVGVEKATAAVAAAEKNLAIVRGYGASSAVQIHDAQIALKEANFGLTDANITLSDAQIALSKLTTDAIPGSVALQTAQNALTQAQNAQKDSVFAITNAQKAYNDLSPTSVASTRAIAVAQMDLQAAEAAVFTQVMNATAAVKNATDFMNGGLAATTPYKDETIKLRDAQFALSQALVTANEQLISQSEAMDVARTKLDELSASYDQMRQAAAAAVLQFNAANQMTGPGSPGDAGSAVKTYNVGGAPDVAVSGGPWDATGKSWQAKLVMIGADAAAMKTLQDWVNKGGNSEAILAAVRTKGYSPYNGLSLPKGFHGGGMVMHGGGLASDEISGILQVGEYVMNKNTVNNVGAATMASINSSGQLPSRGGNATVTIPIYLDGRQIAIAVREIFISDKQTGRVGNLGF